MNYKKLNHYLIGAFILCVFTMVGLNYFYDPLHVFSPPKTSDTYDRQARYGHVGTVRHTDVGDVYVGSSVFQDLDPSVYKDFTGRSMTRIPVPGATPSELYTVLNALLSRHSNTLDRVVIGMDFFVWAERDNGLDESVFPVSFYEIGALSEIEYVASYKTFSRLLRLIPDYYFLSDRSRTKETVYRATYKYDVGEDEVFSHACRILDKKKQQIDGLSLANFMNNFDQYLKPLLRQYRDVEFALMLPTYSILEYAQYNAEGKMLEFLQFREVTSSIAEQSGNVKIIDAQGDIAVSKQLDLFHDAMHGGQVILNTMARVPIVVEQDIFYDNSRRLYEATLKDGKRAYNEMRNRCL